MRQIVAVLILTMLVVAPATARKKYNKDWRPHYNQKSVMVGEPAPWFSVEAVIDLEFKTIKLSDYKGKWLVLFFYPGDFTFVCPTEIRGFNNALPRFRELKAEVIAGSVDSKFSHLAWIQRGDLGKDVQMPLFSDITKRMARSYGVLNRKKGTAERGLFIIDPDGKIQYIVVHNHDVGRSVEEVLRVLKALQSGSLCPLGWKEGDATIKKK